MPRYKAVFDRREHKETTFDAKDDTQAKRKATLWAGYSWFYGTWIWRYDDRLCVNCWTRYEDHAGVPVSARLAFMQIEED